MNIHIVIAMFLGFLFGLTAPYTHDSLNFVGGFASVLYAVWVGSRYRRKDVYQ